MIEWKLFWTGAGTVLALTLGTLTAAGVASPWLTIPLALGAALVMSLVSYAVIDACEMWRDAQDWQRSRVWLGIVAASVAYLAWTITAALIPVTVTSVLVMIGALGSISVLTYWLARAAEWRLRTAPTPRQATGDEDNLLGPREKVMRAALRRAGRGFVRVLPGSDPLRDDAGWQFRVRVQSRSALGRDDRAGAQAELTQKDMEPLAIALAEITGRDVESDWVRLRKERGAGIYSITVANRNLMAEVIEYKDDPTPTSITEPALVGIEIDGREHRERLDQHQRDVGGSTGGKSSLIQLKLAHATRCTDALVWVGGVQKLYDLVGSWVEPYHGTGLRSPLDWIAHGQPDTLEMMAAAMAVARWRQRQPMSRRQWRKIILILDEFSFVAQNTSQRIKFDNELVNASRLASMLLRGAASGDVHVHFASQRATTDHYGDQGGDVIASIGVNNAFRSKDFAEVGRLTNDYKLPVPKEQGEFYRFADVDPLHLKAPYIQTNDPSKPRLHNGATIADISWSRRHLVTGGLTEAEGVAAAGDAYTRRRQVVNDGMLSYLTNGGDGMGADGVRSSGGEQDYTDAIQAELDGIAAAAGLSRRGGQAAETAATAPPQAPTREDRIKALLDATDGDMGASDIAAALAADGDDASADTVGATLSRMVKRGEILRPDRGRYESANQTNKQTNTEPTGA